MPYKGEERDRLAEAVILKKKLDNGKTLSLPFSDRIEQLSKTKEGTYQQYFLEPYNGNNNTLHIGQPHTIENIWTFLVEHENLFLFNL